MNILFHPLEPGHQGHAIALGELGPLAVLFLDRRLELVEIKAEQG